jgi:YHS domain-containing protein
MSIVKDPVCGMEVEEKTAPYKTVMGNKIYYFSSAACQSEFNRNLGKYVKENNLERDAGHYGGYCSPTGCGKPARGVAWYFYFGLLLLVVLLTLLMR